MIIENKINIKNMTIIYKERKLSRNDKIQVLEELLRDVRYGTYKGVFKTILETVSLRAMQSIVTDFLKNRVDSMKVLRKIEEIETRQVK